MSLTIYIVIQIGMLTFACYAILNAKKVSQKSKDQILLTGKIESKPQRVLMIIAAPLLGFGYFIGMPLLSHQEVKIDNYITSTVVSVLYIGVLLLRFRRQDRILKERNFPEFENDA